MQHPQRRRNSRNCDISISVKVIRLIKTNFAKSRNSNYVETPSKAWWFTKFVQGCMQLNLHTGKAQFTKSIAVTATSDINIGEIKRWFETRKK